MTSPESALLTRMNTLKRLNFEEYLTDVQKEALKQIKKHRNNNEPYINLHGPSGSGKTFLCWMLSEHGWEYYQAIPDRVNSPAAIFDHGNPRRSATRRLRGKAAIEGLANVVYVTRTPAKELYPRVKLSPDEHHNQEIKHNWKKLNIGERG